MLTRPVVVSPFLRCVAPRCSPSEAGNASRPGRVRSQGFAEIFGGASVLREEAEEHPEWKRVRELVDKSMDVVEQGRAEEIVCYHHSEEDQQQSERHPGSPPESCWAPDAHGRGDCQDACRPSWGCAECSRVTAVNWIASAAR